MSSWGLAVFLFVGTAFLGVTFGMVSPWNYNFASCLNGDINGICTCPEGKVLATYNNRQLCFDRSDSCPNGYEGLLGTCNCFAGKDSQGYCLKICSNCNYGWCSSTEKCECNPGYKMSKDNKCEPICEKTVCSENGFCFAPEICACNEGYKMSEKDGKCKPICSEKCSVNAYCSAPDYCACIEGYYRSLANYCIRRCDYCNYGVCVSPGNCVAFAPYYFQVGGF